MNSPTSLLLVLSFWLLSGCAKVGTDYVEPVQELPASWQAGVDRGLRAGQPDPELLAEWWTLFGDPLLRDLIQQAVAGNLDLQQAKSRLAEARAQRDLSSAGLFPGVDFSGSVTRGRVGGTDSTRYSLGFDAAWELDLFGAVGRKVEAAEAQFAASREDLRDVLVTLAAEVALNYVDLRTFQARLQIANQNLADQEETYSLTEARYLAGLSTELDLQQARYLVSGTRAQLPNLQTGLARTEHLLAFLLGRPPGSLDRSLLALAPLPDLPPSVAVGIPADILRRRPDIRRAERNLAAQTAQVGAAVADLYPSFTLGGSIGLDALSAGKLFNSGSRSSSFGPRVNLPIFDGGAIRANIRIQSSRQEAALAEYRAIVLAALQEVEDSLTAYAREQERNLALAESVEAARQASALAEIQFQAGLVNFSEVLNARGSLLSFEDQQAQSTGTMVLNLIRLYKALGGGWAAMVPEQTTTTEEL